MTSPSPLQPGDRVLLRLPGSQPYVTAVVEMLCRGIFPVPLDPRLTVHELTSVVDDVAPALVIETDDQLTDLSVRLQALPAAEVPLGRPMHVTSGTTGRPKPVDSGLLSPELGAALVAEERDLWGFTDNDVNLVVSPIYHSAPLRFAMGTQLAGGLVVFGGAFDPASLSHLIATERPTTMFVVPTHLQRLFDYWDAHGAPDLSCFRLVAHAGAPCPDQLKRRLIETFPPGSTWEFYGSTEGQFTACRSEDWLERPGTLGRARPGRRLFTDDSGHLWCVVPEHARFSYRNAPEKTAHAWRHEPDGWAFTVWDLGRVDADGHVYLDGRRDDLIITGGVNVYPLEVERVLREAAAASGLELADLAVYGVPDPQWGQRVCAAYVGSASGTELDRLAREHLAPPKRPKSYRQLDDLPRTATGKVRRGDLETGS